MPRVFFKFCFICVDERINVYGKGNFLLIFSDEGTLFTWGSGKRGQLGHGKGGVSHSNTPLPGNEYHSFVDP